MVDQLQKTSEEAEKFKSHVARAQQGDAPARATAALALAWLVSMTSAKCMPAFRALLRVAARLFDRQLDGQADQQRLHTAVRLSSGKSPVIPRTPSPSPVRAAGTPDDKCNFQVSSGRGKSGILLPLFPGPEKDRRHEIYPRSVSVQQIDNGRTVSHADDQTGAGMCPPGRLVYFHRPERHVFSRLHHPETQEIPAALLHHLTPHNVVTVLSVMQLLDMMSAANVVIPLGLLHMRRLQRWFIRLRIDPVRQRRRMVSIPPSVGPDLVHWRNLHTLSAGVPLGRAASHISVFTDTSLSGWGGTCLS